MTAARPTPLVRRHLPHPSPLPGPLLKAAAETRGAFVLPADVPPAGREAGASLMRIWNDLSDEDFRRLEEIAKSRTRLKHGGED